MPGGQGGVVSSEGEQVCLWGSGGRSREGELLLLRLLTRGLNIKDRLQPGEPLGSSGSADSLGRRADRPWRQLSKLVLRAELSADGQMLATIQSLYGQGQLIWALQDLWRGPGGPRGADVLGISLMLDASLTAVS